jgi:ankyrin repeat protein
MNPDYPTWENATLLHALCSRDIRDRTMAHRTECATILLDAGATISARDDEYRSTPLAWATKRGHTRIAEILRRAGATA